MKKVLLRRGVFSILLAASVVSCKKEEIQNPTTKDVKTNSEFNISSDGRMLIFKSTEDYEKVVNNPTEQIKSSFLKQVAAFKHTTYAEKISISKSSESDDLIGDDDLAQILNDDWIAQIGDYLYRVNKPAESVYVLPANNISEYQDLVSENKSNKNIRKFSTDQDVIELAESGDAGQKALICGESGIGGKESISSLQAIPNTSYQFWCYNDYNKYGIYYSLAVWVRSNAPNGAYRFYIQVENLWYHVRCGNTVGAYSFPWYSESPTTKNIHKYQSYSGSKNLNGVHVKSRGRCEIDGQPQGSNPYTTVFTDWNRIQQNNPWFP